MSSNASESASTKKKPSSASNRIFPSTPEDEIIISGVAGRYPKSDNVDELRENLYSKVSSFYCELELYLFDEIAALFLIVTTTISHHLSKKLYRTLLISLRLSKKTSFLWKNDSPKF